MNWQDELTELALSKKVNLEIVLNAHKLPDLLIADMEILNRYDFVAANTWLSSSAFIPIVGIEYKNQLWNRKVLVGFRLDKPYPIISLMVTNLINGASSDLNYYFIKKSNGKINYDHFDLSFYEGDLGSRVRSFCKFLNQQFQVRGLFWLDGTHWEFGYSVHPH